MLRHLFVAALALLSIVGASPASADCLKVSEDPLLRINPDALVKLASIGIDRAGIFDAMAATAVPETGGCWAGATGNFDGQLVSVGLAQWNFGSGSLQPLLIRYRASFLSTAAFEQERDRLMGSYGTLFFSSECLRQVTMLNRKGQRVTEFKPTDACVAALKAKQNDRGTLDSDFAAAVDALFESFQMRQIQTDTFVRLVGSVRSDLQRLFPGETPSGRKIKWAIDTKVQQGGFPGNEDVARVRKALATMRPGERTRYLRALIDWYDALGRSLDQQGTRYDRDFNTAMWACKINTPGLVDDEQTELLYLSFLRSRTAGTKSGLYQALTFQRRAKIILGVGSVGGRHDGQCA